MATGRFASSMSRRGFLTVGSIGLGGLTLADVLRLEAARRSKRVMLRSRPRPTR